MSELRKKHKGVDIIGLLFIGVGVLVVGFVLYRHFKAEHDMTSLLYNKQAREYIEGGELVNPETFLDQADQNIAEVKVLKNCIVIPSCKIKVPLTKGVDRESLALGAGHFPQTPKVGHTGNACYAGHYSTIYNCIFNDLPKIKLWDKIEAYDSKGRQSVYYVVDKYVTYPTDMSVLEDTPGKTRLTIVTCAEQGTKRLIVVGEGYTAKEIKELKAKEREQNRQSLALLLQRQGQITISDYLLKKDKQRVLED